MSLLYDWLQRILKEQGGGGTALVYRDTYLSCRCWAGPDSESYGERFKNWVRRQLPDFKVTEIVAGNGMRLIKFERRELTGSPAG
jgi:hypothetical protein